MINKYEIIKSKQYNEKINGIQEKYKLMKVINESLNKVFEVIYIYKTNEYKILKEYNLIENFKLVSKNRYYREAKKTKFCLKIDEFYKINRGFQNE